MHLPLILVVALIMKNGFNSLPTTKMILLHKNTFFCYLPQNILHSCTYTNTTTPSIYTTISFHSYPSTSTLFISYIYIPLPLHHTHSIYPNSYLLYTPHITTRYMDIIHVPQHQNKRLISQFLILIN